MKILSIFALIRDVAIIAVCVCILWFSTHKDDYRYYFALPVTSKSFSTQLEGFDGFNGEISNPTDSSFYSRRKIPLDVRIVK